MTEQQVFKEITSQLKWYVGYCSQSYATQIKQKYKAGNLGRVAINNLFNRFGYEVKSEQLWMRTTKS